MSKSMFKKNKKKKHVFSEVFQEGLSSLRKLGPVTCKTLALLRCFRKDLLSGIQCTKNMPHSHVITSDTFLVF